MIPLANVRGEEWFELTADEIIWGVLSVAFSENRVSLNSSESYTTKSDIENEFLALRRDSLLIPELHEIRKT